MKSVMTIKKENIRLTFPKLMNCQGLVVLFSRPRIGVILHISEEFAVSYPNTGYKVGMGMNTWVMDDFVDFDGRITLEN